MSLALKLTVDQISTAILLLNKDETKLRDRLPLLMEPNAQKWEDMGWLSLAESAFDFWNEPEEDVYIDQSLIMAHLGKFNKNRMNRTLSRVKKALGLN